MDVRKIATRNAKPDRDEVAAKGYEGFELA